MALPGVDVVADCQAKIDAERPCTAKAAKVYAPVGEDPAEQVSEDKVAPTIKTAFVSFFEQHDTKIKSSTSATYHRIAEQYVFPAMGNIKVAAVQYRHVASLHYSMKDTPYQANRMAALLSKFFGWCEKNGYRERGSNPVNPVAIAAAETAAQIQKDFSGGKVLPSKKASE